MYEKYTRQSLPERYYRELLGTAVCVFNSNIAFIIENILQMDNSCSWYKLIDEKVGKLLETAIKNTVGKDDVFSIVECFREIVKKRNRIIHSFQITNNYQQQILATKEKGDMGKQFQITEKYLLDFIKDNEELCCKLYSLRSKTQEGKLD